MARNTRTKERVVQQFLDGTRIFNEDEAWAQAVRLAEKQQSRSRDPWVGEVETYEHKA
jgi:hypothetical protein